MAQMATQCELERSTKFKNAGIEKPVFVIYMVNLCNGTAYFRCVRRPKPSQRGAQRLTRDRRYRAQLADGCDFRHRQASTGLYRLTAIQPKTLGLNSQSAEDEVC